MSFVQNGPANDVCSWSSTKRTHLTTDLLPMKRTKEDMLIPHIGILNRYWGGQQHYENNAMNAIMRGTESRYQIHETSWNSWHGNRCERCRRELSGADNFKESMDRSQKSLSLTGNLACNTLSKILSHINRIDHPIFSKTSKLLEVIYLF